MVEKKTVAYWKAQCAFRGLNQSGAISDLQLRLREAKKPMLPELKEAEKELNKQFKKQNKSAKDGSWKTLKTAEQQAKADPRRYLTEVFPKSATGRPANLDIVVVKVGVDERIALADAAEQMGLQTGSVEAPWTGSKKSNPDRWQVIGRTSDAVLSQMRAIEREAQRSKNEMPEKAKTRISKPSTLKKDDSTKKKPALPAQKVAKPPAPSATMNSQTSKLDTVKKEQVKSDKSIKAKKEEAKLKKEVVKPKKEELQKKQTAIRTHPFSGASHIKPEVESKAKKAMPEGSVKSEKSWDVRGSYIVECPESKYFLKLIFSSLNDFLDIVKGSLYLQN
jgi:hypothetical protein